MPFRQKTLSSHMILLQNGSQQLTTACYWRTDSLDEIAYVEVWRNPMIHIQPESYDLTPMNVWFTYWSPWNELDQWCGIQFRLPALTVDSYQLDPDKIYWRMHINDDIYLFDCDEYPQFTDLTEWVPYNSDGLGNKERRHIPPQRGAL